MITIHPENRNPLLNNFATEGGLFDAPVTELNENIGKRCKFINPTCGYEKDECTIIGVQKIWNGSLAYRVMSDADAAGANFGKPARPETIEII